MRPTLLPSLILLAACATELELPPPPGAPVVTRFSPHQGWAGTHVFLEGSALGTRAAEIEVHFGTSGVVRPLELGADANGTRLEVIVPEDAQEEAPITVVTNSGRGSSEDPFTFLGAGRLRRGSIATTRSLRTGARTAFVAGPASDLFLLQPPRITSAITVRRDGGLVAGRLWTALAIAPVPGTDLVAALTYERFPRCDFGVPCPPKYTLGYYEEEVLAWDDAFVPRPRVSVSFEAHDDFGSNAAALAISDRGTFAFVAGSSYAWAIDFRWEEPTVGEKQFFEPVVSPAWVEDGVFVYAYGALLGAVNAGSNYPFQTFGAVPYESPQHETPEGAFLPDITALAVQGQAIAVGTAAGTLDLGSLADWPPTDFVPVDVLDRGTKKWGPASIAFSADGARVAATYTESNRVVLVAPGAVPHAVAQVEATAPRDVLASGGAFWVGGSEGAVAIDPGTGAAVARVSPQVRPSHPHLRVIPCSDTPREVLEVPLEALGYTLTLDPLTLQEITTCLAASLPPEHTRRLVQSEVLRRGKVLVLVYSDGEKANAYAYTEGEYAAPAGVAFEPDADGATRVPGRVALLSDESAFAWLGVVEDSDPPRTRVRFHAIGTEAPVTYVDLPGTVLDLEDVPDIGLVATAQEGVFVFNRAAALEGRYEGRTIAWSEQWDGGLRQAFWSRVYAGRAWLLASSWSWNTWLLSVPLTEGPGPQAVTILNGEIPDLAALVPGADRVWWIIDRQDGPHLHSRVVDAHNGTLEDEEPPLQLPAGITELLPYRDGSNAVLTNPEAQELVLLQ